MIQRLAGLIQIVLAAVAASAAIGLAGWGQPTPGVVAGERGAQVEWVLPGGPSWRDGIRPGQTVVELQAGSDPRLWRLETVDRDGLAYATGYASQESALRGTLPFAIAAGVCAALGVALVRRLPLAVAASSLAFVLAGIPAASDGGPEISTALLLAGVTAVAVWLMAWGPQSGVASRALGVLAVALVAGWTAARYLAPDAFGFLEFGREGFVTAGSVTMLVLAGDWRRWRNRLVQIDSARLADIALLSALLGITVLAAFVLDLSLVLMVALVATGVVLYPRLRRGLSKAIDQIVLAEARDRASLTAVENERGRIARDLHDEPLQELAAVIRQLDRRPDTTRETELLRGVADHLRRVTTELRPPILDDLGLRAAIEFVADQASVNPSCRVELTLLPDDPLGDRPPREVELAIFRIVQEAVDNAVKHSGAETVSISATVTAPLVVAEVVDDGVGISESSARDAALAGHIGLVSMAQRAALIGASFAIGRVRPNGTRVAVRWREGGV